MTREELEQFISKSLPGETAAKLLIRLEQETARRPVRTSRCAVYELPHDSETGSFRALAPGTVTAFIGRDGDPVLQGLAEALKDGNAHAVDARTDEVKQTENTFIRRISSQMIQPARRPAAIPSLGAISYLGKSLITHVPVNADMPINVQVFPYNGGALDKEGFTLLDYYADREPPLRCVAAIRAPVLSTIEKEALRLVPQERSINNIATGPVALCPMLVNIIVLEQVLAAIVVGWVVERVLDWLFGFQALASIPDSVLQGGDLEARLKQLPPDASAAELVALRSDLLLAGRRPSV